MDLEHLDARLAETRFAGRGHLYRSVSSTNDTLQELARAGAPEGSFVLAAEQTVGRGRHGHRWISRQGLGLYLSVLFRPRETMPTRWTIAAGIAACDACRSAGARRTTIRWPNDLFAGGCKLGGILVETRSSGATLCDLVIGVGINVHHDDGELRELDLSAVTSLRREVGSGIVGGRGAVAAGFLERLETLATTLGRGDWEAIADAWAKRATLAAAAAVRVTPAAGEPWSGLTDGLAEDGALRARDTTGELREVRQVDSLRYVEEI